MSTSKEQEGEHRGWLLRLAAVTLKVTWTGIRVPALALLLILEPLVCGVLAGVALLGVLCALFFRFVAETPRYPFWLMMAVSAGLAVVVVLYHVLVRLLSGFRR